MINTPQTRKAMQIAFNAHKDQLDKSDVPYIFHPMYLAEQMDTEEECIVALLHDVVEDSDMTFEQLEKEFSANVISVLKLLTHDKAVDYMDYVKEIKKNPIATKVKIADLTHNSDLSRLNVITEKDLKRKEKYQKALDLLKN